MIMTLRLRTLGCLTGVLAALGGASAWADGTLTHMSGPVSVQKLDGRVQVAAPGITVLTDEILITGTRGYVRMEMTDGGEIVLRPDSQLKVESYSFDRDNPAQDNFVFNMIKGGLRTVTGLIGKRGNRDAYKLKTSTSTIGIRGTHFDLRVCQANCGALPDGTYLAVRYGAVQTSNNQGSLTVAAGQVVHIPLQRPPLILPRDPGIGFTAPPSIPKLNERKKQAAEAAAASAPKPDQTKSATAPAQSTQNTQRSGQKASTESTATSASSGGAEKSGSEATASSTATLRAETALPDSPLTETAQLQGPATGVQSTSGADCSVQ